jgi:hypothetical protein
MRGNVEGAVALAIIAAILAMFVHSGLGLLIGILAVAWLFIGR